MGKVLYGNIADIKVLKDNIEGNCIPSNIVDMDYSNFLLERRKMMAAKIKNYYYSL